MHMLLVFLRVRGNAQMAALNSPDTPPYILFVTSSFGEYKKHVSENLRFFQPSCSLSEWQRCTTVDTEAGRSALDAPSLPYRILCTEQFVKDASRTETVETDSLSQMHATRRGRMSQCREGKPDLTVLFLCLLGFLA